MDMLKKFFPYSFAAKKDVAALVINIIVYIVVGFIAGALIGLLWWVPIVNIITGILGSAIELYILIGLVLTVLDYCKILK